MGIKMGIIESAREKQNNMRGYSRHQRKNQDQKPTTNPKILDLTMLKDYVSRICDFTKVEQSVELDGYRKHHYVFEWPIANIIGAVDEPTWVYMVETSLEWAADTYGAVQANGDWQLYKYEVQLEDRLSTRERYVGKDRDGRPETVTINNQHSLLILGVQFVDMNGERDLVYDMGRPTTRREQFDPSVLKQLMSNAPEQNSGQLSAEQEAKIVEQEAKIAEQAEAMAAMQAEQTKMNAMMAELLSEMKGSTPPASRSRAKK
jgi:uncharacterized coiled-coil protein SlyX